MSSVGIRENLILKDVCFSSYRIWLRAKVLGRRVD